MERVWMYVDGFSFYYCLKYHKTLPIGLGWCDFRMLAEDHLMPPGAQLEKIKYFTTLVEPGVERKEGETARQDTWLRAARTIPGLTIIQGSFLPLPQTPGKRKEKLTDVNIAVELVLDAVDKKGYDTAILITGDSDLAPAVLAVQARLPVTKVVKVWLPPGAPSGQWRDYRKQHDTLLFDHIPAEALANSRLPYRIDTPKGRIDCPSYWQLPAEWRPAMGSARDRRNR